jgi:hypothetical protein
VSAALPVLPLAFLVLAFQVLVVAAVTGVLARLPLLATAAALVLALFPICVAGQALLAISVVRALVTLVPR